MQIIKDQISHEFKHALQNVYQECRELFCQTNSNNLANTTKKINYINIYHEMWDKNRNAKYQDFINLAIQDIGGFAHNENIVYVGFLSAPIDCDYQFFHIDYDGKTDTYFIPLVDINDSNGTEYLNFYQRDDYEKYFNYCLGISNNYLLIDDIIDKLTLDCGLIYKKDFDFKIHNSKAYSLYKLNYNILHRGKKNMTNEDRILFQITTARGYLGDISDEVHVLDAELDEKLNIERIISGRKKLN